MRSRNCIKTLYYGAAILLLVILASPAPAQVDEGFTFVAYGDSRTMIYIPYGKGDEDKIHAELVRTFALILGETVAEGIVKKDVKLTFDSKTGALTGVEGKWTLKDVEKVQ